VANQVRKEVTMNSNFVDRFSNALPVINKIVAVLFAVFTLGIGIYRGINSGTASGFFDWTAFGFAGSLIVLFTFLALDFSMIVWDKSTSWLSKQVRKYPYIRAWIILLNILFAFYAAYLVLKFLNADLSLRIFISIYLIWFLPAASISLVREDLRKEHARLSTNISRETRIHNPQAAIENAFTHFENHLLNRVSGDSTLYGNRLIRAAYEGDKSKLVYKHDGKDYTAHLNNLMSGAYSILRNPRHHKIVDDDEQKAEIIIPFVELLIEFVDKSEEREIKQASDPRQNAT
jgi:hypothetical protein